MERHPLSDISNEVVAIDAGPAEKKTRLYGISDEVSILELIHNKRAAEIEFNDSIVHTLVSRPDLLNVFLSKNNLLNIKPSCPCCGSVMRFETCSEWKTGDMSK